MRAAAAGQVAQAATGAAAAPAVAVTLPARAAVGAISVPVEAFAHGVKIAIILRVLRKLLKRQHADSVDWLTQQLRKAFPDADPAVIRQAVEREMRFEEAFQAKSMRRVEGDLQKAGALPTPEAQQKRVNQILAREQHYAALREKAMLDRSKMHVQNAGVKAISPRGAKWVLGARKNHTLGCLALAGKNWPWEVLDTIPPPIHTGCGCELVPLKPDDTVPPVGEAMAMAKAAMALEEALRAAVPREEINLFLAARAVAEASGELEEMDWKDWLHPRGRGGKWIDKIGPKPNKPEPEPKLPGMEPKFDKPVKEGEEYPKPSASKVKSFMPELSPESTVVSGAAPKEKVLGGDAPEPAQQGAIPSFGHVPLSLQLPPAFGADHIKAKSGGETYIVKDHGGDRNRVGSELLANAIYRELGVDVPTMGSIKTEAEPDFEQRAEDLPNEPPLPDTGRLSTGIILREPDGRMTVIEPRNHYGGYIHTFPKGGVEPNLTPQQNAHKELWEETGLHAHITGVVGDFKGDTGTSRYYLGVRTGGEATPSDETEAIKTVTPEEAAQMLNKQRDQDVLKALLEQPIPTGSYEDSFPPEVQGQALAFKGVDGKTKDITSPNEALGRGYMADALLANRDFLGQRGGNVRWANDDTPIRTSMSSTFGNGIKSQHEYGDTPEEVWTMRTRGQGAGTISQGEDELRQQAADIARILTAAKINELTKAAPLDPAERKRINKALKARVAWMRRFADGTESLPQPATGADARAHFADAQASFDIYPEEHQALEEYAGDAGRTLDGRLTSGKNFTEDDRKLAKRLDAVLEASKAPVDTHVYMGAPGAPNEGMVGKSFSMKPYIRAHTDMANAKGQMRMRLLVPGDGRALHLEDAEPGQPDMLLPRDQRVHVTGMGTGPDGVPQLDGIVLPYRDPSRIPSEHKPYVPGSIMSQTTIKGLPKSKPKGEFFKKGDRVDVNGNKATVTGDAGKGMANVKLDSGKGYTVPFSILKRLEESDVKRILRTPPTEADRLHEAVSKYEEALHPRGRGGKWIGKGGPKIRRIAPAAPSAKPVDRIVGSLGGKRGDEGYQALASGKALDTQKIHQVDGKYTEGRQLLHQHIIDHFFANAEPVKNGKAKAIFTAGGAASGKSGLAGQAREAEANLDIPKGAVYINPDDIKEMIPEYNELKKQGREDIAAAATHEESSDLAKVMTAMAMKGNYPVIVDGTGNSRVGKFGDKLRAARKAGYDVEARYAHVPVGEAIGREKKRAERTGRKVAESLLREQHKTVAQSYVEDVAKEPGVHVKVYSTVERGKPKLIAESRAGTTDVHVVDKKQYDEHLAKAKA